MTREELLEKMQKAWSDAEPWSLGPPKPHRHRMAAALDVAVGELLGNITSDEAADIWKPKEAISWFNYQRQADEALIFRRSRYLPKSDPAVKAISDILGRSPFKALVGDITDETLREIVAAVRKADHEKP